MGRYVPPEQEGVISGNQLHGKLPPGRRRKVGHADGGQSQSQIQTVRFEMPFAVWCHGCAPPPALIAQGVRFNAVKKRVGSYFSTPIWAFRIRHGACGKELEIRTDPKNTEYIVAEGGRRRDYGGGDDGSSDGAGLVTQRTTTTLLGPIVSEEESERRRADAFAALEGRVEDRTAAKAETSRVAALRAGRDRDWEDPYAANRRIRRTFRAERKVRRRDEAHAEDIKDRYGLGIDLVAENEVDLQRAKLVAFGSAAAEDGQSAIAGTGVDVSIGDAELSAAAAKPLFDTSSASQATRPLSSSLPKVPSLSAAKEAGIRGRDVSTASENANGYAHAPNSKSTISKSKSRSRQNISSSDKSRSKTKLATLQAKLQGNTRAVLDPFAINKDLFASPQGLRDRSLETNMHSSNDDILRTSISASASESKSRPFPKADTSVTSAAKPNLLSGLKRKQSPKSKAENNTITTGQTGEATRADEELMTDTPSMPISEATQVVLVDYDSD